MNQPSNVRLGKTTFVHQDLISKETSDLLFRNDGNKFTDVSSSAGIESAAYGLGLCISDINQDGYQDIYIAKGTLQLNLVLMLLLQLTLFVQWQ